MSTSTVSITANPAASRRRPVVIGEKRTSIEVVASDGGVPQINGCDDRVSGGRDLSHSIRGETAVERSRDIVHAKKGLASSTVSPRRSRRTAPKPDKPRWQTIVSVFTKNLLLLLVLAGLVQMIRKFLPKSPDIVPASPMAFSDFEGRIAEVENFVKKTTKMMQVQVEVVDKKIENEVVGLRKELSKRIEDKSSELGKGIKSLDDRILGLENAVGELTALDLLSKEDIAKFFDEMKTTKGTGNVDGQMSLNDVRAVAKEIIVKEIEKHAADGLGMADYALAQGGAMVVKHSEPFNSRKGGWFPMPNRVEVHSNADKMLKPSFGQPGECFPLKGSSGFVQIRLRSAIIPEAITLEHVAKSVAYDRSSAPKDCRVSGWLQGRDAKLAVDTVRMFRLVEFTYDLEKSNAQTFNVLDSTGSGIVNTIRLDFTSNHGSPSHTCIYRLRVHGHEPSSVSLMSSQS